VSGDLRERFDLRCSRLDGNLGALARILARRSATPGSDDETLPGLAWLLEASYSEMEEVLKGVARHCGDALPASTTWHRDLLDLMAAPSGDRPTVLSEVLKIDLEEYRAFRHFSRNATFLVLDWERMRPLVDGLESVVGRFRTELEAFLRGRGL